MKIHLTPTGTFSPAMVRISNALARYAPAGVSLVKDRTKADVAILYVIAPDAIDWSLRTSQPYVAIQCCFSPHHHHFDPTRWTDFWARSILTWSYYDLSNYIPPNKFYLAPIGVDAPFTSPLTNTSRDRDLVAITTGLLSGVGAEAIEEVWTALSRMGARGLHIGPRNVVGMSRPVNWSSAAEISDEDLAHHYSRAKFIAALRHVEGFELPAAEGLCMGARPIMFDLPCYRKWYDGLAVFVPECSGDELVARLIDIVRHPSPVSARERDTAIDRFNWEHVAPAFWSRLTHQLQLQHIQHTNEVTVT